MRRTRMQAIVCTKCVREAESVHELHRQAPTYPRRHVAVAPAIGERIAFTSCWHISSLDCPFVVRLEVPDS